MYLFINPGIFLKIPVNMEHDISVFEMSNKNSSFLCFYGYIFQFTQIHVHSPPLSTESLISLDTIFFHQNQSLETIIGSIPPQWFFRITVLDKCDINLIKIIHDGVHFWT